MLHERVIVGGPRCFRGDFGCRRVFSVVVLAFSRIFDRVRLLSSVFERFPALSGDLPAWEHDHDYRSKISRRITQKSSKKVVTEPSYGRLSARGHLGCA